MENNDILLRIRQLMKKLGFNISGFAKKIDVSQPNLSQILKGNRSCGDAILNKIVMATGCSKNWLLTGEGEMLPSSKKPMGNVELLGEVREIIEEETVPVKFFELNPTAGFSMQYFLSEEVSTINIIPSHGERLGDDYCAFKVKGESMAPQIQSNALILCQEIPPTRWYSIGEAVVVIVYEKEGESYGVLKRIKDNRLNDHNYLLLSSDNPEYPHTEKVALAEIRCIFRAVRVLSQRIY